VNSSTPKNLKGALENALTELRETKASKCGPDFVSAAIDIIHKHVQDRLAQDFSIANLTNETPEQLWERVFGGKK